MSALVIIGGSDAGTSAALRAKEVDSSVDVKILLADAFPNYSICGLPFYLSGEVPDWRTLAHRTIEEIEKQGSVYCSATRLPKLILIPKLSLLWTRLEKLIRRSSISSLSQQVLLLLDHLLRESSFRASFSYAGWMIVFQFTDI
jgi:hypothetical protein